MVLCTVQTDHRPLSCLRVGLIVDFWSGER